jgi:hypothetical protein
VRTAVSAVNSYGTAGAGARPWSAPAGSANPSAMCAARGFGQIMLTHKAVVRPRGLSEGSSG